MQTTIAALVAPFAVELNYSRGWSRDTDLSAALRRSWEMDQKRGFTSIGPQRADLLVRINGGNAEDMLSRGQQKLVVTALHIAQGHLLDTCTGKSALYLVDDLPAELDAVNRRNLCGALLTMGAQILITCIDPAELAECWLELDPNMLSMFHVEQGRVSCMK